MTGRTWRREGLSVHLVGSGLYLDLRGDGLLLDAPGGVDERIDAIGALGRIRGIALSGGRIESVGGLVPLLCALEPHRLDQSLPLRFPLGEERGASLADVWVRGWAEDQPLEISAEAPGSVLDLGPFSVRTFPIRRGEPRWRPQPHVIGASAVAFRVEVEGLVVAWVAGAGPGGAVRRACDGADLAVVEVGVKPWPPSDQPWRMSVADALTWSGTVETLWLVGDDGEALRGAEA